MISWRDVEREAPEIARLGRERLDRAGVGLLGTLRRDGSPRISPVEPFFARGHLLLGAMTWSSKARDLLRDPRCVLHSAVSSPDGSEGELKLYGRAEQVQERDLREDCPDAWWVSRPPEDALVFSLDVERAVFVSWDTERGRMTLRRWSREGGYRVAERGYP